MEKIHGGSILIADPFLKDPNFLRTVVFLCNYNKAGSVGFVINRKTKYKASELLHGVENCSFPVFYGGPVQQNTIHFLHCCPGLIPDGEYITDDIYRGGDFEETVRLLNENKLKQNQIKLFIGYSGWDEVQLEDEIKEGSWLTSYGTKRIIFMNDTKQIWPEALRQKGGKYEQLINYPNDPQLN